MLTYKTNLFSISNCSALVLSGQAIRTLEANRVGSVFNATVDIRYLEHGQCAETSTSVHLNDIEWSVKLCKSVSASHASALDVALVSKVKGFGAKWHCDAQATIKLFGQKVSVNQLPRNRFTNYVPQHFIRGFIHWTEFSTYHVSENQTTFEVALSTNVPNTNEPSDVDVTKARIHVMLENVSKLTTNLSPEVVVRGIRWRIATERFGGAQVGMGGALSVYLAAIEEDFGISSCYKVNATFKLLTYDPNVKPAENTIEELYHWGVPQRGFNRFLRWESLFDAAGKYILGDKANILVEFSVEEPKSLWDFNFPQIQ